MEKAAYTVYGGFASNPNSPSGGILITSLTSGATLANISCPLWLTGLALSPNGGTLYAFGQSATGFDLEVVDTASATIVQSVTLPSRTRTPL